MSRRLSQALSEGGGISLIVAVRDAEQARAAAGDGAVALFATAALDEVLAATDLPVLAHGDGADACIVDADHEEREVEGGAELVVRVDDEEQLSQVLERLDPELVVLAATREDAPLEHVLSLLSDVPAGKLAIVELDAATRADVDQLERAGVDAVLLREPLPRA